MFGGYAPFPLRLQPGAIDNVSAAQWNRLSTDVAAALRTLPFCIAKITVHVATGTATVAWYSGRNGVGVGVGVSTLTLEVQSSTILVVTLPEYWVDDIGAQHKLELRSATATPMRSSGAVRLQTVATPAVRQVFITIPYGVTQATDWDVVLVVYSKDNDGEPRLYGADDDKADCLSEDSQIPLVSDVAEQIQLARGDSYTPKQSTVVGAETLALARGIAAIQRQGEASRVQRDPSHAAGSLPYWAGIFRVDTRLDPWVQRQIMSSRWVQSMRGTGTIISSAGVDSALQEALGPLFVATHRPSDSITDGVWAPAYPEWWPLSADAAPMAWDANVGHWSPVIGPSLQGAWTSGRMRLVVEVTKPAGKPDRAWLNQVGAIDAVLSPLLPAWCTWDWCTDWERGYVLGSSLLGYTGVTQWQS